MTISRARFVAFAIAAGALSFAALGGGLLAADLYLHSRAERSAGLNRNGYRGPVAGRKRPGELRVIVLGASTVFGYGVLWHEAFPAVLERLLNDVGLGADHPRASVVNLGYNGEGSYAMLPTLQDFAYLDADVVCLYPGDTDHMGDGGFNTALYRHRSVVFRLTGYFPILPLALEEKAMAWRHGGRLDKAYAEPANSQEASGGVGGIAAAALELASKTVATLGQTLESLAGPAAPPVLPPPQAGCPSPWKHYCDAVHAAIQYARARGKGVIVLAAPALEDPGDRKNQLSQQRALADMLARKFGEDPAVVLVPLAPVIDLSDRSLSHDGTHATPEGNARIARALVEPVRTVAGRVRPGP